MVTCNGELDRAMAIYVRALAQYIAECARAGIRNPSPMLFPIPDFVVDPYVALYETIDRLHLDEETKSIWRGYIADVQDSMWDEVSNGGPW